MIEVGKKITFGKVFLTKICLSRTKNSDKLTTRIHLHFKMDKNLSKLQYGRLERSIHKLGSDYFPGKINILESGETA